MSTSTSLVPLKASQSEEQDFHDLFDDLPALDPYNIKKHEIAAQLSALLSFSGLNRSEFARRSGWKKSRVSNVLNNPGNLTFKTMWEFARNLGYEADIHFRLSAECHAFQPWQPHISRISQAFSYWNLNEFSLYPRVKTIDLRIHSIETAVSKVTIANTSSNVVIEFNTMRVVKLPPKTFVFEPHTSTLMSTAHSILPSNKE